MNNYTTARAPLRLSELSSILEQRIKQPAPTPEEPKSTSGMAHSYLLMPTPETAPAIKARRKPKAKKS